MCHPTNVKIFPLFFTSAVDGGWTEWANTGQCSSTCGQSGKRIRQRSCTNPAPSGGGRECPGDAEQKISCNFDPCPCKYCKLGSYISIPSISYTRVFSYNFTWSDLYSCYNILFKTSKVFRDFSDIAYWHNRSYLLMASIFALFLLYLICSGQF